MPDRPRAWAGVYPAVPTPFREDEQLDLDAITPLLDWTSADDRVRGVVCGAHAGEVAALTEDEVVALARACVGARRPGLRVVAAVLAEGVKAAIERGRRLVDVGVDAILLMPPHHWLRFGHGAGEALDHVGAIAEALAVPTIVHEYPFATRAGYGTEELTAIACLPSVVAIKSGTRDMAAYAARIRAIRDAAPETAILTCHDEALLPSIVPAVDGALVAAASLVGPQIADMLDAVARNDLHEARRIDAAIEPVISILYGADEPGSRSHALLKVALAELGVLPGAVVRRPVPQPGQPERVAVREALRRAGLLGAA